MGPCTSKDKVAMPNSISKDSNNQKKPSNNEAKKSQEFVGIKNNQAMKTLSFHHSPLRYCDFLFSKFKQSDGTPQEVNLGFMLNKCVIDVKTKEISLSYINSNELKIWMVYGGIQKVFQTGLTVQISNYKQIQQIVIKKPSSNTAQGDLLPKICLKQTPSQNILLIFSPLLQNNQSIFMIYRYQIISHQKYYSLITQSLQWSSLAFRISDIYGSEYLFKCNDQNEVCSICLTSKSQCILLPCRHMCICTGCLQQVEKTKPNCPLCRKQYYSVVKYRNN